MFESLMMISVRVPTSPEYTVFQHEVVKRTNREFGVNVTSDEVNPVVAAFYDSLLMYAYALNDTLTTGGDPRKGRQLIQRLWNKTFYGGIFKCSLLSRDCIPSKSNANVSASFKFRIVVRILVIHFFLYPHHLTLAWWRVNTICWSRLVSPK